MNPSNQTQSNQASTGVNLESPILSPTHFDQQKAQQAMNPQPAPQPAQTGPSAKTMTAVSIVLGVLAVVGIGFGVFGLIDSMGTHDELDKANQELVTMSAIVEKIESDTGAEINSADDVPDYAAVSGYIYVTEWGIKIKIPDNLHKISYILDQKYRPQICFNALESSVTNVLPAFADVDQNPGGMGCLLRVSTSEGSSADGYSFGEQVYTYDGYNYFYQAPSGTYSTDASEQGLENTAVQIIKTMLSNGNISSY